VVRRRQRRLRCGAPIDFKPLSQPKASATDVVNRLRKTTARVPAITFFAQARQDVQIGARVSKTQYQYAPQDPYRKPFLS
jgi:hypothetical protein